MISSVPSIACDSNDSDKEYPTGRHEIKSTEKRPWISLKISRRFIVVGVSSEQSRTSGGARDLPLYEAVAGEISRPARDSAGHRDDAAPEPWKICTGIK
jgi:hypothetical protein